MASSHSKPEKRQRQGLRRAEVVPWVLSGPILALFIIPGVALIARVPVARLWELLGDHAVQQALLLSVAASCAALVISVVIGAPLACALAAKRRRRGAASAIVMVIEGVVDLPTILPPAVAGLALLLAFGRRGVAGPLLNSAGIEVAFTLGAVVLAQVFVSAPFFVRSFRAGIESVNEDLLDAAAIDGAMPLQRFVRVTLPLAGPGFAAGAALCFARSIGEFGATIIFAGNLPGTTQTMPLAIYSALQVDLDRALLLGVLLLGGAVVGIAVARLVGQRGAER